MQGHTYIPNALDLGFNHAVGLLASRYAPGWQAADDAPNDFETLKAWHKRDGFITVWKGASDSTIFGEPYYNWAFRAWHDAVHLTYDLPFTQEGEEAAAEMQCQHIMRHFGDDSRSRKWCELIRCEVAGQAAHYAQTGEFPADQIAFAKGYLAERGIAV